MMAWHKDAIADPSYDSVLKTIDSDPLRNAAGNGTDTHRNRDSDNKTDDVSGHHVSYSAIDEVKTNALHTALATHRRKAATMGGNTREDVSTYAYVGSPKSSRGLRAGPLFDPSRHKPEAAADPKKRRYVNVSNSQLLEIIKHEQGDLPGAAPVLSLLLGRIGW